jgi:hypothetical protein
MLFSVLPHLAMIDVEELDEGFQRYARGYVHEPVKIYETIHEWDYSKDDARF